MASKIEAKFWVEFRQILIFDLLSAESLTLLLGRDVQSAVSRQIGTHSARVDVSGQLVAAFHLARGAAQLALTLIVVQVDEQLVPGAVDLQKGLYNVNNDIKLCKIYVLSSYIFSYYSKFEQNI